MSQTYEDTIIRRNFQLWRCKGTPPLWAQDRQGLVGALPWFHNAQAGFANMTVAHPDGTRPACGLLANGYGGSRNYLDTEIAILSINSPESNSNVSASRKARMQEAIQNRCLVGIIIARRATNKKGESPSTQDVDAEAGLAGSGSDDDGETGGQDNDTSAEIFFPGNNIDLDSFESFVLGWFLPVRIWPEVVVEGQQQDDQKGKSKGKGKAQPKGQRKIVWMVKLQIQDLSQQVWWASPSHPNPPSLDARTFGEMTTTTCTTCNQRFPQIYQEGFVCFNEQCSQGPSHIAGTQITQGQSMTYSDDFLKERIDHRPLTLVGPDPHPDFTPRFAYTAPIVQNWDMPMVKQEVERLLKVAVCTFCRMANSRVAWTGWKCENKSCTSPLNLPACPPRFSLHDVQTLGVPAGDIFHPPQGNYGMFFANKYPTFYKGVTSGTDFIIHNFELKSECLVKVMEPKRNTNSLPRGSDYLYQRLLLLAETDGRVDLRRRKTSRGFLTNHFNQNFGEPYQMKVSAGEMSFEQAPPEIREAVGRANGWTNQFRATTDGSFNEMYLAGYLHESRMNFHQDGERGLNDKILTWSLGGCGTFTIAVESKICKGKSTGGNWLTDDPLVPGSRKYTERVALKASLANGELTQAQWLEKFKKLFEGDKGREGREVLTLPATHGILILMHGKDMQKHYQHKMEVHGPMRFALTFRHIGAENQAPRTAGKRKAVAISTSSDGDGKDQQSKRARGGTGNDGGSGAPPSVPSASIPRAVTGLTEPSRKTRSGTGAARR